MLYPKNLIFPGESRGQEGYVLTNRQKFHAARARDKALLAAGIAPLGLSGCDDCAVLLQETVTGSRYYSTADVAKRHVCSDCYYDALDEVVTSHPMKPSPTIR
jgi:hypothetical protein